MSTVFILFTPCCCLHFIFCCCTAVLTCVRPNTTFCCISHTMKLKLLIYIILSYSAHNCPITDESVTCNAAILLNSTHPMADFFFSVYPLIFHDAFSLTNGGVWSQSPVNYRTPHTEKQKIHSFTNTYRQFRVPANFLLLLAVRRHANRFTTMTFSPAVSLV